MTLRRLFMLVPLVAAAAVLVSVLRHTDRALSGPQPVAWDHEACAHCRMLVSEPAFAAQIVEPRRALHFDDPGCLLAHLGAGTVASELWFHHHRPGEDRWLRGDRVGFRPVARTPMGYGLAADDAGAPGTMTLEEARRQVAARASAP